MFIKHIKGIISKLLTDIRSKDPDSALFVATFQGAFGKVISHLYQEEYLLCTTGRAMVFCLSSVCLV